MPEPPSRPSPATVKRIAGVKARATGKATAHAALPPGAKQVGDAQKAVTPPDAERAAAAREKLIATVNAAPSPEIVALCERIRKVIRDKRPPDEDALAEAKPEEAAAEAGGQLNATIDGETKKVEGNYGAMRRARRRRRRSRERRSRPSRPPPRRRRSTPRWRSRPGARRQCLARQGCGGGAPEDRGRRHGQAGRAARAERPYRRGARRAGRARPGGQGGSGPGPRQAAGRARQGRRRDGGPPDAGARGAHRVAPGHRQAHRRPPGKAWSAPRSRCAPRPAPRPRRPSTRRSRR